jgi:prepilin-type N-terminal cleavage/methylation domain-containing protein
MKSRRDSAVPAPEAGFSLIELMIALLILSIGILGLAGVTAYSIQKVTVADLDTVRGAALQSVVEQLRATPRDSLKDGVDTVGVFDVAWSVVDNGSYSMVEIVTTGPGLAPGTDGDPMPSIDGAVADTFTYILTGS